MQLSDYYINIPESLNIFSVGFVLYENLYKLPVLQNIVSCNNTYVKNELLVITLNFLNVTQTTIYDNFPFVHKIKNNLIQGFLSSENKTSLNVIFSYIIELINELYINNVSKIIVLTKKLFNIL